MSALQNNRVVVQNTFQRGIVRDTSRQMIPRGGVYDMVDYMADRPGVIYKRGGTTFQSSELTDELLVVAVAAPEFPGDPRVLAIGSDGSARTLYDVTDDTAASGIALGTTQPIENPPSLYLNADTGVATILCDGTGDGSGNYEVVQKAWLDSSTVDVDDLGGTPPVAKYSCAHLSYLVLANGFVADVEFPNRLWFSPIPDLEGTWDTDNAYIDVDSPITGLASVSGVLIVFTRGSSSRILGDLPPGSVDTNDQPNDNMILQPLGAVGCIDARSIVKIDGRVYFANEAGVYYTPGDGYESITDKRDGTGVSKMWSEAVAGYSPELGSVICAGVWLNNNLLFTVRHADDDPQAGARYQFLWHGQTEAWTRLSDAATATMYATRFAPQGEIYAGCGDLDDPVRVLRLSGMFTQEGEPADANGETVEPVVEFAPFYGGPQRKAFGFGHLSYNLADYDNPTLSIAIAKGTSPGSFVGSAPASFQTTRKRFNGWTDTEMLSVKVFQTGASASTSIFALEMEARGYDEDSELG